MLKLSFVNVSPVMHQGPVGTISLVLRWYLFIYCLDGGGNHGFLQDEPRKDLNQIINFELLHF